MGIDVETLRRLNVALGHRQRYRTGDACRVRVGTRDVVGVIGVAVAHDLGINVRPASQRVFHALQHEHTGAFAHHKAVAIRIERTACRRRVGVGGESTTGCKARNGIGDDCGLGTAGENRIGIAVLDGAERLAHGMGRGRARSHHGQGRAFCLVADRDIARRHVGNHHRNHIGRCTARPPIGNRVDVVD